MILLSLLLLVMPAHAGSVPCGDVDNSSHFGSARDQGAIGWCYAFAMSDLLGEYLELPPPDKISAFDMAAAFASPDLEVARRLSENPDALKWNSAKTRKIYVEAFAALGDPTLVGKVLNDFTGKSLAERNGGFPTGTMLTYALKGGYCLESQLPSQPMIGPKEDIPWLKAPSRPDGAVRSLFSGSTRPQRLSLRDPEMFIYRQIHQLEVEAGVDRVTPRPTCERVPFGLVPHLVNPLLQRSLTELALGEVRRVIDEHCGRRIPYPPPMVHFNSFDPGIVREQLSKGRSLEVSYNIHELRNPMRRADPYLEDSTLHSSLIIGMRPGPGGTCEYKIRNSWGQSCEPYDPALVKDCKDGQFWVGEEQLGRISKALTRLER